MASDLSPEASWGRRAFGVGAAYFVLGFAVAEFAIRPGYATAVWPPAGLSLAAVVLWGPRMAVGVVGGSALLNLVLSLIEGCTLTQGLILGAGIGLGAGVEALVGGALSRRFVAPGNPLTSGRGVGLVLVLGGPVAGLTNSFWAVSILRLAGVVSQSAEVANVFTWWVGDAVGVFLVAPLLFVWTAEPTSVWRRRRRAFALPMLGALAGIGMLFVLAERATRAAGDAAFRERAAEVAERIEQRFERVQQFLRTLAIVQARTGGDEVTFHSGLDSALDVRSTVRAVGWRGNDGTSLRHLAPGTAEDELPVDLSRFSRADLDAVEQGQARAEQATNTGSTCGTCYLLLVPAADPVTGVVAGILYVLVDLQAVVAATSVPGLSIALHAGANREVSLFPHPVPPRGRTYLHSVPLDTGVIGVDVSEIDPVPPSWAGLALLVGGMGMVGLLAAGVLDLSSCASKVEIEVTQRVAEAARANASLLRTHRELRRFSYMAAHDLREPARAVRVYLDLVTRESRTMDTGLLTKAGNAAGRLQHIVEEMISVIRVTEVTGTAVAVPLTEVVAFVRDDVQDELRLTQGQLEAGSSLPIIRCDPARMEELLRRLVDNALKFRKPGVPPLVRIEAERTHDGWEIAVQDNGIGIDPKETVRIFGMFQRLNPRHMFPGEGVGLAICRRIVEQAGGRIWVVSEPGVGSTFHFTLPDRVTHA